jgi:hypothetical protein
MALPKFIIKLFMLPILFIVLIVLASLIEPLKTMTDSPRGDMNCPNTSNFNQTAWSEMDSYKHIGYSTGCYLLNWDVLLFVGLLSAVAIWGWFNK